MSLQIVRAGGEYLWIIKDHQPETLADLERLFAPEPCLSSFSPASHDDFETAKTVEKGHGRMERHVVRMRDGKETDQVVYGVTSLTQHEASPLGQLELIRRHWAIENGLWQHPCHLGTLSAG